MTNFPDAELEALMLEEIVLQALSRGRNSGFYVPES